MYAGFKVVKSDINCMARGYELQKYWGVNWNKRAVINDDNENEWKAKWKGLKYFCLGNYVTPILIYTDTIKNTLGKCLHCVKN